MLKKPCDDDGGGLLRKCYGTHNHYKMGEQKKMIRFRDFVFLMDQT